MKTEFFKACCTDSARRYLKRHRDVAVCDGCGFLLMAYENPRDYEETLKSLESWGGEFSSAEVGKLRVVAKSRSARPGRGRQDKRK